MVTCKLCDAVLKKNAKYFCSHECANEYRIKIKSDELISNLLDGKNIRVTNGKVLKNH